MIPFLKQKAHSPFRSQPRHCLHTATFAICSRFSQKGASIGPFTRQKRRNGSGGNEYRFQQNLSVYTRKFCKGTDKNWHGPQKNEERIKTVYTLFFARPEPIEPEI